MVFHRQVLLSGINMINYGTLHYVTSTLQGHPTGNGTLCAMDKRSLEHLARRFREAETRAEILRLELAEAIREAARDGVLQKDICEATGYTRQQVRRIVLSTERKDD